MAGVTTDRSPVRFDEYELDPETIELKRAGEVVAVEPQVFDVLAYLVAQRHRVVPKTELLDNIWGDRFVSESALTSRIKSARQAVGDDGRTQRMIRTAHGRGYQFVGPIVDPEADVEPSSHGWPTDRPDGDRGGSGAVPGTIASGGSGPVGDQLISREAELAAILAQLGSGQLVTLVGPGGVGKTRLAAEVSRIWEDSGDRTVFAPLEDITDAGLLLTRLCGILGLRAETEVDPFGLLCETLRDEAILLVLDNFEQLTAASGELGRLVAELPKLRLLVTSRDRLRLSVERTVEIEPLATDRVVVGSPPGVEGSTDGVVDAPAVLLFEQFARQADPGFRLDDTNREAVARVCRLVDGLPLAIGLAAAQLRYLSLEYLISHLETNASSIADSLHDRPERQHSVSHLVGWSYELLTPAQQVLLARLSVFTGGWSLAGAAAVGRFGNEVEALAGIAPLVDKSLVRSRADGGAPRFSMLNVIGAFATAKLETGEHELDAYRDHGDHVADLVRSVEQDRWGPRAGTWLDDLDVEHANIVTALERAEELGRRDLVGRIIGDLNMWWYRTGRHTDGRRWIDQALGGLERAEPETVGRVHLAAGFMAFSDRNIERARFHYEQAIEAAREVGDWRYEQQALANLSATSLRRADEAEEALARLDRVIEAARDRGELVVLAHALNVSGVLLRFGGEPAMARSRYEAAREANRTTGDRYQEAMNLGNLAHLSGSVDQVDEALTFARSALAVAWRIGSQVMCAWTIGVIAGLLRRAGSAEDATKLLSAATAILHSLGAHSGTVADQSSPEETRAALREALGDARFEELSLHGRGLRLEAAVELALGPEA